MKKSIQVIILFAVAFMGINTFASAQDEIIKNNGKKMNVWIKEVGDTQIKYIENVLTVFGISENAEQ